MAENKLVVLSTDREELKQGAVEILEEGIKQGFETVCVIGVKDGTVWFRKSANVDTVRLLGMIEVAKQEIWDNWK